MRRIPLQLAALFVCGAATQALLPPAQERERVSAFGVYEGYGDARYETFDRESFTITVRDGTRLACDLYRPQEKGRTVREPLPLVWTHDRYHRAARMGESAVPTQLGSYPWLGTLLAHGYVVAAVDARGTGASFGTWQGIFDEAETRDAYDVTEWFAAQEWCDGNIGMYGAGYSGGAQYRAAGGRPPHLRALFPWVAPADLYEQVWSGGIYRDQSAAAWGELVRRLDRSPSVASVDGDEKADLVLRAIEEHAANLDFEPWARSLPYRDSQHEGRAPWIVRSPLGHLDEIEASGVAIYQQGGWLDPSSRDAFLLFANLENPRKLVMGPWFHTQAFGVDWEAEALRWFDRWLKDIDNGIMEEAPIHYFTIGAPEGRGWRSTRVWPLAEERRVAYSLRAGPSGSVSSVNDGILVADGPPAGSAAVGAGTDLYTVDYRTSSGRTTRWSTTVEGDPNAAYADLRANDERCLTYTTAVLEADIEVTGHPLVHLWVATRAADVFVYLEEVRADGTSEYVSEGSLRVAHRRLREPPHDRLGLPYHGFREQDVLPATDEPMELVFDLFPTSNVFDAGHRIRVSIAGADDENALTAAVSPPPTMTLHRGGSMPSFVELPVIPPR